ncbi:MAG TPA: hypothetical protein P5183_04825, partial [Smithellaceae bacterium]|nr:hypothetical protein [Smithellaceae bacterium]
MINKPAFFILLVFLFLSFVPAYGQQALTLSESVDIALKNSHVLNIAREGTRGARAQKREAVTGFLPKFS